MANTLLPRHIWLIHDPLDGTHLFRSKREAVAAWKRWEKEASSKESGYYDSFWDMKGPAKYILAESLELEKEE